MKKESLIEKIFGYLIAIALVALWIWPFIDGKDESHNSYCDYNDCHYDPRL